MGRQQEIMTYKTSGASPLKAVIIEDDREIIQAVSLCFDLRWPDVEVVAADTGRAGVDMVEKQAPDIVILDIGLPDIDGFEVCRQIRLFSDVPIIMLTVRDQEFDKIKGLELGADDYVTKPFSHVELLARIKAALRRSTIPELAKIDDPMTLGKLWVDFATRQVRMNGHDVNLTRTEFDLLCVLARNAGRVVPHEVLLEQVWGPEYSNATDYLKVYIQRLRAKLQDNGEPQIILSERGVGYRLSNPAKSSS